VATAPPVLVLGATGTLGARVVRLATTRGHAVTATWHRRPPPEDRGEVAWRALDVVDPEAIDRLVGEVGPGIVVNCAYVQHGSDLRAITTDAAVAAARAAARVDARLVQLSSDVVFAGRDDRAYVEHDTLEPLNDYGRAKVDAEAGVLHAAPDALVVRTSLIYGGDEPGPQERLVARALAGEAVQFFTDEWRCPVHADDLAAALLDLVALDAPGGVWHAAGAEGVSRLRFAQLLAVAVGGDPAGLQGGAADHGAGRRPGRVLLDSSRAEAWLGRVIPGVTAVLGRRA
jgi:dTDP-4-dehydrorhamnose reductase